MNVKYNTRISKSGKEKGCISIAILGHVDSGKSTTCGRLLLLTGEVTMQEINSHEKYAESLNKKSFKLAFVMDKNKEERERGVTISTETREFETENKIVTIVDCPGHRLFQKNAIHGMSQVGYGLVVLSASDFIQAGMTVDEMFDKAPNAVTHVKLLRNFQVKKVIIGVNKIDEIGFDEVKYNNIVRNYTEVLKQNNYSNDIEHIKTRGAIPYEFIPYSAFNDINVETPASEISWYKGKTLLSAIDTLEARAYNDEDPAVAKLTGLAQPAGKGLILTATILSGVFRPGMKVIVKPSFKEIEIKSIESDRKTISEAKINDAVGFSFKGKLEKEDITKDSLISELNRAPKLADSFICKIKVEAGFQLSHKSDVQVYISTGRVSAVVEEIISIQDAKGAMGTTIPIKEGKKEKRYVPARRIAIIKLKPTKPTIVSPQGDNCIEQLSRVTINDGINTLAMGVIIDYTAAISEVE